MHSILTDPYLKLINIWGVFLSPSFSLCVSIPMADTPSSHYSDNPLGPPSGFVGSSDRSLNTQAGESYSPDPDRDGIWYFLNCTRACHQSSVSTPTPSTLLGHTAASLHPVSGVQSYNTTRTSSEPEEEFQLDPLYNQIPSGMWTPFQNSMPLACRGRMNCMHSAR